MRSEKSASEEFSELSWSLWCLRVTGLSDPTLSTPLLNSQLYQRQGKKIDGLWQLASISCPARLGKEQLGLRPQDLLKVQTQFSCKEKALEGKGHKALY